MPAVGVLEQATSSAVVALPSLGILGSIPLRHDPPDPAAIDAAGDVHVLEDLRRQERRALDQLAAHVDDPEAAVGGVGHLHRAEEAVARGEELAAGLGIAGRHEQAVRLGDRAMDEVVGDVADEQVAAELGRVGVAAIDRHPGRRR